MATSTTTMSTIVIGLVSDLIKQCQLSKQCLKMVKKIEGVYDPSLKGEKSKDAISMVAIIAIIFAVL